MKQKIFENLGLKVSAVLIAVFLWFFVTSQGQSEISLEVPLEFKNIPAELGIAGSTAKSVMLTIRGQERFMKNLNASNLRVFLDLGKAKPGEIAYPVNKEDVKLPFAMTVTNVAPPSVRVKLEEIMQKTVSVQPQLLGSPEEGAVISVVVEPKTVVIRGLKSELGKIDMIRTEPFDISHITGKVTEELGLDTSGTNIKPDISKVKVKVKITPEEKRR
ncbi:MAG: CdaR family protein [Nitrospirota bacterium]|nr:CdaR family protein [Nitrospirota bacterium]